MFDHMKLFVLNLLKPPIKKLIEGFKFSYYIKLLTSTSTPDGISRFRKLSIVFSDGE